MLLTTMALTSGAIAGKVKGKVVVAGDKGMVTCIDDAGEAVADSKGKWSTAKPATVGNACKAGGKVSRTEVDFRGTEQVGIK